MRTARAHFASLLLTCGLPACGSETDASLMAFTKAPSGPTAEPASPASAAAIVVAALPLRPGYYVAVDVPCGQASNATVSLLRAEGIGGSRDFCEFSRIEKVGPRTYRVTQACREFQGGDVPHVGTVTYTLSGDWGFVSRSESGWEHRARHCVPSSMPAEWQRNDMRQAPG